MFQFKQGNILNATEDIICNQVDNDIMENTELSKQIKLKYPEVFEGYKLLLNEFLFQLGHCQLILCNNGKTIANLFNKIDVNRDYMISNIKFLKNMIGKDWEFYFLKRSLENLLLLAKQWNLSIAIPYGIGCSDKEELEWEVVYSIIENVFNEYDVSIYKLD